jgi:hypothetical protein
VYIVHGYCSTQQLGRSRGRLVNLTSLPHARLTRRPTGGKEDRPDGNGTSRTICAKTRQQTFGALRACQLVIISRTASAQKIASGQFLERYLADASFPEIAKYVNAFDVIARKYADPVICGLLRRLLVAKFSSGSYRDNRHISLSSYCSTNGTRAGAIREKKKGFSCRGDACALTDPAHLICLDGARRGASV